jgi:protein involved in polysaccharide export with SLBB domain
MKSLRLIILPLLFISQLGFTQMKESTQGTSLNPKTESTTLQPPKFDLTGLDILKQIEPTVPSALFEQQILEGPVDVNNYVVGPNDIFSLGVWGILNQPIPLTVTPEGSIIVPSVGEVDVSGLTLAQVKEKVISKVKQRFISGEITFTLVSPRRFSVTVTGVGQGIYPTAAVLRASALVSFVYGDSVSLMKSGTSPGERNRFSLRNITLTRKNGSSYRIDFYKYFATHDDKYNPYLREGDVINLPKYDWDAKFISVFGCVQFPGMFEYIEGDDLETAIQLVRGVTTVANMDSIMISRLDPTASKMTNFYLKYEENKDMKLQPNDRVVVLGFAEQRRDYRVLVLGEVIRVGLYPITVDHTHLSEIILDAGGFSPEAYLPTSELYRKLDTLYLTSKNRDTIENLFTQRLNDIISNKDEKEYFENETKSRIGRVNLDFENLFYKGDRSQDVTLRDGDVIYIANNKKTVYVYGQVNQPGYVPYKDGADYKYYIDKAGGLGERADEGEIRVIKFKTREWLDPDDAKIESNDFIYVPKVIKRDFAYDIDIVAKVTSVLVTIITLTLLVIQLQK